MPEAITVHCPSCETAFPVDPEKVPAVGVRARCSVCSEIFPVDAPSEAPETETFQASGFESDLADPDHYPLDAPDADATAVEETPAEAPDETAVEPEVAEAPAEEGGEPGAAPRPAFGQRSPEEKAKRLARVLVSDMISYNPELYDEAMERGTLEEDFEDEIEKSWEEYVEQVGDDMAESTSYWTDALNEILAKGEDVF